MNVWMDVWINGWLGGWIGFCMDVWIDEWIGWNDVWMNRWMNVGWLYGWTDGWMDGLYAHLNPKMSVFELFSSLVSSLNIAFSKYESGLVEFVKIMFVVLCHLFLNAQCLTRSNFFFSRTLPNYWSIAWKKLTRQSHALVCERT